ncbi:MAG: PspC domain-containing protein [Gammaproteobacteria bacterium]|nr:PspC domain-containing protein [Gammaproteobacteria bacterium]
MNSPLPPKRLYRARDKRVIAGVCGGIADFFNIDPTWVRLILASAAVLMLLFGNYLYPFMMVFIIYAIAWIVVPISPKKVPNHE